MFNVPLGYGNVPLGHGKLRIVATRTAKDAFVRDF